jgi:hypothetical protein
LTKWQSTQYFTGIRLREEREANGFRVRRRKRDWAIILAFG